MSTASLPFNENQSPMAIGLRMILLSVVPPPPSPAFAAAAAIPVEALLIDVEDAGIGVAAKPLTSAAIPLFPSRRRRWDEIVRSKAVA